MASAADKLVVTVKNWDIYNPRGDVKRPSWFRLEHSLLDDPDFYGFSHEEFHAWIYILAQASKKNSAQAHIDLAHAKATAKLSSKAVRSAIEKLSELGMVTASVTGTVRARTQTGTTERNGTNETDATSVRGGCIFEIWNKHRGNLPEARELNADRKKKAALRWGEHPAGEYWVGVIERMARSSFCRGGGSTGWKADFDFLLQPGAATKVLEGKYDDRAGSFNSTPLDDPELRAAKEQADRVHREMLGSA